MKTDTELLDWLEEVTQEGACPGLINDDNGHWAVSFSGIQDVPSKMGAIYTTYLVEAHEWRNSIREAILAAMEEESTPSNPPAPGE
jgi:hypothetical protein